MIKNSKYKIIVDSREQRPLWTKNIVREKLDVGDYSIEGYKDKISIERKSLADAWQTMLGGNKRFHKELERAESYDYFAMVIEGPYTKLLTKDFPGSYYSKVPSYRVLQNLFTFNVKHKMNLFFCTNRVESKKVIKEIFDAYLRMKV